MEKTINQMKHLIYSNNSFETVQRAYDLLSDKYGKIVIAGGSMTDLLYSKEFYDVDVFIEYKDLKPEWKRQISPIRIGRKLIEVFRDSCLGIDIDIVVVGIDVYDYMNRFDLNIKRIWYDGSLNIHKQAAKDFKNQVVSLNNYENTNAWFRLYRTSKKYNLCINEADEFIVLNHLSMLKHIPVSAKYKQYLSLFKPIHRMNIRLANVTEKYMKSNHKSKHKLTFINFQLFKLIVYPYLKARRIY